MKKIIFSFATLFALAAVFAFSAGQVWQIKEGYSIQFSSKDANGIFKDFSGTITFDETNLAASKFNLTVEVASINTGNGLQNKHAKGADWFDAEKYPNIKFTSSKMEKSGDGFKATGTLEMHGVKKEIGIPFKFKKSGAKAGTFTTNFSVNRSDYGIGKGNKDVAETIKIDVKVPVVKK